MDVKCPNCDFTGKVSSDRISDEGRILTCPKCKKPFEVKKTLLKTPLLRFIDWLIQGVVGLFIARGVFKIAITVVSLACISVGIYFSGIRAVSENSLFAVIVNALGYLLIFNGLFAGIISWIILTMK